LATELVAIELDSDLLVVTNFLEFSGVLRVVGFAALAAWIGARTGFAGGAFAATIGFAAFFGGVAGAAFFAGTCFAGALARTGFATGLAMTFFAGAVFTGFFAGADLLFATGLAAALLEAPAAPRIAGLARAGAFAACAFLPAFCLLLTIPRPIL
jgi:hypothetical protein